MSNSKKLSLTFRVDSGVIEHNNRTFKAKNVDAARTSDNIIYKSENLQEKYHELFDEALENYNARKRSNEKNTIITSISKKENRRNRFMKWLFNSEIFQAVV